MPLAIIACFDSKMEQLIDELKKNLLSEHAPRRSDNNYIRPHLTLTVSDNLSVEEGQNILKSVCVGLTRFPVEFSAYGLFTQPQIVLYLAPAMSAELVRLFNYTHALVDGKCRAMYSEGAWTPHCTLASVLKPEELIDALRVGMELPLPIRGEIAEINLFEIEPLHLVESIRIPAKESKS
jgi:2'-5' RNA ligase